MVQLTAGQKNIVDTLLLAVGALAGFLTSNGSVFPVKYQPFVTIIGAGLGYFASDALTFVDTGVAPSSATLGAQATSLWKGGVRDQIIAEINAKVTDPTQRAIALAVIAEIDQKLQVAQSPLDAVLKPAA